jgi:hypothetical protein
MKKILYILVTLNLTLVTGYAQPSITWNRLYEGGYYQDDACYGLCKTTDGNYVLGGMTDFYNAMVIKIDAYGNVIWLKHFINSGCKAITATSDGGSLMVAGAHITKITTAGDTSWSRFYLENNISDLFDVIQCSDMWYSLLQ